MDIKKIWEVGNYPTCGECTKEECKGKLKYDDLCSNINYLREYGERNFEKNKTSYEELRKAAKNESLAIFSFGCGIGLDYVGAREVFGEGIQYYPIDQCKWAITKTKAFKENAPKLPNKIMGFTDAMFILRLETKVPVLCFFNSLFTISQNTDLKTELTKALSDKKKFYIVCDYTINNNYHFPSAEEEFLNDFVKSFKNKYSFKKFDILDGKGVIIAAEIK
jgi:hypothetical protein